VSEEPGPPLAILAAGQARRYGGLKPLAPVGPGGEAIIDLVASDALDAGFSTIVVVIGPQTGPTVRRHIEENWPRSVDVQFALQAAPRGTVDAVLAALEAMEQVERFGVANADDLYGTAALEALAGHLQHHDTDHALVGFKLARATIGKAPVTRGVCRSSADGRLDHIDERRGVVAREDGTYGTGDHRQPEVLAADTLVSMNLWGFQASVRRHLADAVSCTTGEEVLLPDLVARLIGSHPGERFRLIPTDARCVGVTHPEDLSLVQADVLAQIDAGERTAGLWASTD
jgi:CTP:molybdopterin cytidylyltransferase MocA